ncbi:hypothetical protein V6N11_012342 [Hibiscus sabdariffa]|uniref:Uncharacterized protein n=1 Tax=Hibiscus sabdariffa TaxID=183260 RepID=A0ABR2QB79_9ROSI
MPADDVHEDIINVPADADIPSAGVAENNINVLAAGVDDGNTNVLADIPVVPTGVFDAAIADDILLLSTLSSQVLDGSVLLKEMGFAMKMSTANSLIKIIGELGMVKEFCGYGKE